MLVKIKLSQTSPCFVRVCSTSLLKTPWEKEKLLIMSNFSFYHSVFYSFGENFLPFSSNLKLSFANSFNLEGSEICRLGEGQCSDYFYEFKFFPNKPLFFTCLQYKSFENTIGNGEIAHNE